MKAALATLAAVLLICGAVAASDHKRVAGDALELRKCYWLLAPMTIMSGFARAHALRNIRVPEGNMLCIDKVDNRGPRDLWYRGKIIRFETLDESRHMPVWVDSRDLMEHGVMEAN